MHHVFVYGTLKEGLSNHRLLKEASFVGRGITLRPFFMCDTGGYPVVFEEEAHHNVSGEVYEVDDATLNDLDHLEGHPSFFQRREILVDIDDTGIQQTCWMYFGVRDYWKGHIKHLERVKPQASGAYAWRT